MRYRIESLLKVNIDDICFEMVIKIKGPIVDSFEHSIVTTVGPVGPNTS